MPKHKRDNYFGADILCKIETCDLIQNYTTNFWDDQINTTCLFTNTQQHHTIENQQGGVATDENIQITKLYRNPLIINYYGNRVWF